MLQRAHLKPSLASRCHHLLETFEASRTSWRDEQMPDGADERLSALWSTKPVPVATAPVI